MSPFDLAAVVVTLAAAAGYLNHRWLRLPPTSGTMVVAIVGSLMVLGVDLVWPSLGLQGAVASVLGKIDFNDALLRGMLCFLLFAGALNVNVRILLEHKWTIGLLATVGVVISTTVVGGLTWMMLRAVGTDAPVIVCLIFGAVISPTDPIAVLALLKEVGVAPALEAQIAGEALFNDGVGVVVFFALVSAAGLGVGAHAPQAALNLQALGTFLIREVVGGTALGLAVGLGLCVALRRVDAPPLELLMTLALVMATYAIAFPLGVSGPIAVVVAGLVIGHVGRQRAMSAKTREYVEEFWGAIDELLNVVLFVLLGLQVVAVPPALSSLVAAAFSVPIVLIARLVSVGLPVVMLSVGVRRVRGFVPVLTWAGLRGGLSVAMVLSLPAFPERRLLLACTSIVVVFSILVQGLSMRRMLEHYQLAAPARRTGRP